MNVKLPPEQQKWLEGQVAAGHFASLDDALSAAVADVMAIHRDELAWAKPYVEQARTSVAHGDVMSGEDYFKRLDDKLAALRDK